MLAIHNLLYTNIFYFLAEYRKIRKRKPNVDKVGLLVLLVNIGSLLMPALGSLTCFYFHLDPGLAVVRLFNDTSIICIVLRYVFGWWATLEGYRCIIFWLPTAISLLQTLKATIEQFKTKSFQDCSITKYKKIQIIVGVGLDTVRYAAGVLMSMGFVCSIAVLVDVLTCYKSMPVILYILMVAASLII